MADLSIESSIVSSADAVRIMGKTSCSLVYRIIPKMIDEITALYPHDPKLYSFRTYSYVIAAAIWTAGRVQGIREERARRKGLKEV